MDTIEQETDEERAERIQRWRLSRALRDAPALLAHVRSIAISGRGERGEVLREWSVPLRVTAVDDIDDTYERLIYWVMTASEALKLSPAATTVVAWSVDDEVKGFRGDATPEGVELLTRLQTAWMQVHEQQLQAWETYETFRDDVLDMLWSLRAKYPMTKRRERTTQDRECPACGEQAVSASWWSDEMREVDVSCSACGFRLEPGVKVRIGKKRVGVLDLLDWETRENRDCTCRYPGDPISDCPVHHPDGVEDRGGLTLAEIPKLAAGGVVPNSGLVLVGERERRASVSFVDAAAEPELRPGEVVCASCFMVKPCPCEDGQ